MNNNEYYDYEDRRYVNPVTSRDEQLAFIENLRNTATNDIAKIRNDTYNLGTHIPSNLGGLTGSTGLWRKNFVSPKVESMTQGLRAVAQSSALEGAMNNYLKQQQQRYQNAYKAAAKRAASGGGGGGGGTTGSNADAIQAYLDWLAQQGFDTTEDPSGTEKDNPEPPTTQQGLNGNALPRYGDNTLGGTIGGFAGAGIGSMVPGLGPVIGGGFGGLIGSLLGSNWGKW